MTSITLELPDSLIQRADQAARTMHRPVGEVIVALLDGVLPSLEDAPEQLRDELLEMTWLDDNRLLEIADAQMSAKDQVRLAALSGCSDKLSGEDQREMVALRECYGAMTLRKARALALLSVRSGKCLLDQARAA